MFDKHLQKILAELKVEDAVKVFSALGHKKRLDILLMIYEQNPTISFSSLAQKLSFNPNTLSHHLDKLVDAGLLRNRYEKNEGTREYSMYELTDLAKKIIIGLKGGS